MAWVINHAVIWNTTAFGFCEVIGAHWNEAITRRLQSSDPWETLMGFSLSLQPAHTKQVTCTARCTETMQDIEPSLSAACLPYCPKNTCLALSASTGFCNFYKFMDCFSLQDAAFFVAQTYSPSRPYSLLISAPLYSFSCPILLCNFSYSPVICIPLI